MEQTIRTFTVTITQDADGVTIERNNNGIAPHELVGICNIVIAEQTKKLLDQTEVIAKKQ